MIWRLLSTMNAVLLALLALSWPFIEPGSGTRTIALVSLAFVLASMVGLGAIIRSGWDPFH